MSDGLKAMALKVGTTTEVKGLIQASNYGSQCRGSRAVSGQNGQMDRPEGLEVQAQTRRTAYNRWEKRKNWSLIIPDKTFLLMFLVI